tara:strand:- start:423 stop:1481 length:1059 start_codon:yes stop_codon:yes gene_type:complete
MTSYDYWIENKEKEQFTNSLSYDDVLLAPQYSEIISRTQVDIGSELDDEFTFALPLIASPMDTISGVEMAVAMSTAGGLAVLHRYNKPEQQSHLAAMATKIHGIEIAAAVGVSGDFLERAQLLYSAGVRIFCLDVAHGHHILMKRALSTLKSALPDDIHLMAGNVATLEGFNDLADWGADSIRVGIGGGSICSTRIQTGHGIPTFQSVLDCARTDRDAKIIADGGIKNSGDIVKVLAAGADFVMAGSILAGTTECPGEILETREGKFKTYRGMASKDAQMDWRGKTSSLEGVSAVVPYRGGVVHVLSDLERGIRSGFSYSGAVTLKELQAKANFIKQTPAGQQESSTHIKGR